MRLEKFLTYRKGKSPLKGFISENLVLYLTPEYLRGNASPNYISDFPNKVEVKDGDLILLWDGSNAGEFFIGKTGVLSSTMVKFYFDEEKYNRKFLYYQLKAFEAYLKSQTNGSGIPHVDKELLLALDAESFEKPEQSKIATILSKANNAIAQTEALISKYQLIKTGLMQDLLTKGIDEHDIIRNEKTHRFKTENGLRVPEEWEVKELKNYISYISYGFTNPMPEAPEGPYLITAANINEGRILYESCRRTTDKAFRELLTNKSRPKLNDVLITKDGSLGRMAIVDRGSLCINQSVAVMRTIETKIVCRFFKMLLESSSYQATIIGDSGGSTIKHIYITKIDKMLLAIPKTLDEQNRILTIIENHDKLNSETEKQLHKLQSLKTGLMQDLLSGKVRVKIIEKTLETKN